MPVSETHHRPGARVTLAHAAGRALSLALLILAAVAAAPAAAQQEILPPPPPPPDELTRDLPPPEARPRRSTTPRPDDPGAGPRAPRVPVAVKAPPPPGTIGDGPVAAAGSVGAPLHPDDRHGNWKYSLASGVVGRFGGYQLHTDQANAGVLLFVGGQADGLWAEDERSARLRLRLFTGGERIVYLPSDGEFEAAYMLGRKEFRFVVARAEVGRYTGLAVQTLAQLATLPSVEGSLSVASDRARLFYSVAPVELAWVSYFDRAHIRHSAALTTETDHPDAATAARARVTFNVPPAVLLSLEGELVKLWGSSDMLAAGEASAGVSVLDRTVLINVSMRWEAFTRRDKTKGGAATTEDQFLGMAAATLVF